jgi:hypothetical protein
MKDKDFNTLLSRHIVTCREDFNKETMKPRTSKKNSCFPGFLMNLYLVASLRLCVKNEL